MDNLKHLLYILSVIETQELEEFKSTYNLKSEQELFAFLLTSNDLDKIINENFVI